jgi:NADPH:quinone reductase-like Zn-dependent oxidoreductase
MKAVVYYKYGPPEVLSFTDVEKPIPSDDEVLVKVHAASVNSWDWDRLTGRPYLYRLISGISKPRLKIPGCDIAGTVVEVGRNVRQFKVSDEVFGDLSTGSWGGFAEFTCARENELTLKPASMSFEEAASIPQAATLALQGLRNRQLRPEEKVLINGAGGGVGTFGIQIAKMYGAEVTCVDKKEKLDALLSLGADHVIDYEGEDFTRSGKRYDLILDTVANHTIFDYLRVLNPSGNYVAIGGTIPTILQAALLGSLISRITGKKVGILAHQANKDMDYLKELFGSGQLRPVISGRYSLSEAPEALRLLGEGHVLGKVVVSLV